MLPERERRYLGCIRLSLAALYEAEVVDGTFKVCWGWGSHSFSVHWEPRISFP